jgi:hypothetical protein
MLKIEVFWDMTPLRLVNSSTVQTMKMETESSAETLLFVYQHGVIYPKTGILLEFKHSLISFWYTPLMLIYWMEAYIKYRETEKL